MLLVPMQRDLGWSRSVLSGAFSTALVIAALMTIPVGRWLDRHPPRPLLLIGAIAGTTLVLAWSSARGVAVFYAIWAALGACMAILFYEPAFTVLTKWLHGMDRHRAITAVTLVAGLASTIFGPLTAALERALGWRGAVVVLGCILGAVTVPSFAIALGARPSHGGEQRPATAPREAMASRAFWYLTGAYLLSAVTTYAVAVHLVPFLLARGWNAATAATALGSIGLVQVAGRGTFTRLSMRFAAAQLGTLVLGAKALGLAVLLVRPNVAGVAVFVLVYGAANGLQTLTRATVIVDLYGVDHYGAISATVSAVCSFAGALAPFVVAAAIDIVGSDVSPMWALVAVSVAAAALNATASRDAATASSR